MADFCCILSHFFDSSSASSLNTSLFKDEGRKMPVSSLKSTLFKDES